MINTDQMDKYSGGVSFLCASMVSGRTDLRSVCKTLVTSKAFEFALDSDGCFFYKNRGRLNINYLDIETSLDETGMAVSGHSSFVENNPSLYSSHSFHLSLNLLLSDNRLFNSSFGFPAASARVFMRPIFIKMEGADRHDVILPHFRFFEGGVVTISLIPINGFNDLSLGTLVNEEVNRSRGGIVSLLCEKEIFLSCVESEVAELSFKDKLKSRSGYRDLLNSCLMRPVSADLMGDKLDLYELSQSGRLTLSDVSRNLLKMVSRAISHGAVRTRINWLSKKYVHESIDRYWCAKPLVYVTNHTRQKDNSAGNMDLHRSLVNSVLCRVDLSSAGILRDQLQKDLRSFDDYNSFYSESASLVLLSAETASLVDQDALFLESVVTDNQVLNEAAHLMQVYCVYFLMSLEECKTSIDVAEKELEFSRFEESLLSSYKFGEIVEYFDEVRRGDRLSSMYRVITKKLEAVRKGAELKEKVKSEAFTRRITIIFGVIASATLSPELMQPLAKYYGFRFSNEHSEKLVGISASIIAVFVVLIVCTYIFKAWEAVAKIFKRS